MKYTIDELIYRAGKAIENISCDYAEIKVSSGVATAISLSGDSIDSMSSGNSTGCSVRLLKDGAWGFVSFNNVEDIEQNVKKAFDAASVLSLTEKSAVFRMPAVKKHFSTTCVKPPQKISIDEKFNLIQKYNNILKSSNKIQSTRATYLDRTSEYVFVNTEGTSLSYDRTYCGILLASIAKDGALIQPFSNSLSAYAGFETAESHELIAEHVVKTAIDLLKAESAPGQNCKIIADQKLAGVFIHEAFGHLSEADFVYENDRMREIMTLGRQFGPEELNVFDDGNISSLSGYIPFDDEGVLPQRTALITNGSLTSRLHSRETAQKMNETPTGNGRAISAMADPIVRMTNTYIENGQNTKEDIFAATENGIYAVDVIGGQTNLEMFTFTSGYGYEIKNGKLGKMYRDVQLSGNVFTTLKNILMIGNDKKMFGGLGGCGKAGQGPLPVSFGGPHLLIDDVLVGGKQ